MKKLSFFIILTLSLLLFCGAAEAADNIYSASVEGTLSLHISPDEDSFVITQIPACSKLKLIETERTWGLVEFNNKAGWINLSYTRDSYSKAAEATGNDMAKSVQVSTKNGKATLYSLPSDNALLGSVEKYTVPNQTVLKITRQTDSGWGLVSMHGKYAWIKMKDTSSYDTQNESDKYGIYYVYTLSEKGEGVNLYTDKKGKNLCAVIPDCIKLTVRETEGKYGYVSYDGINGYINLKYTTQSLANAQSNAGEKVNAEYIVNPKDGAETVPVYSIPSENPDDAPGIVGEVKKGDSVYVLRSTLSGWNLVNCAGQLGWISPENTEVSQPESEHDAVAVYEDPQEAFVVTIQGKGLKVYSMPDAEKEHSYIPETAKIRVLAEKDGFKYIYSDYAAGWVKEIPQVSSYEEALGQYPDKKKKLFSTTKETQLMTLPTASEVGGSEIIKVIPEGKYFEVLRTVSSGKSKWVLAKTGGQYGWIKKSHTKEEGYMLLILLILLVIAVVILIAAITVYIIRRKKNKTKRVDENEKSIQDEHSGACERTPDVSRK